MEIKFNCKIHKKEHVYPVNSMQQIWDMIIDIVDNGLPFCESCEEDMELEDVT